MIDLTAWLWSVFSFTAVCSADCRLICWARWWPAWTTETGYRSHVYQKTGTFPLIFRKNQSPHYTNDEVWETVKKVWNYWRVMDARMNTVNNYVNPYVCIWLLPTWTLPRACEYVIKCKLTWDEVKLWWVEIKFDWEKNVKSHEKCVENWLRWFLSFASRIQYT